MMTCWPLMNIPRSVLPQVCHPAMCMAVDARIRKTWA